MQRHIDADAYVAASSKVQLTFTLGGRTFSCVPRVPAKHYADMVANSIGMAVGSEDPSATLKAYTGTIEFVRQCVVPEQRASFDEVIASPDILVPMEAIFKLYGDLVAAYAGLPLDESNGSSPGQSATGT